MLQGALSRASTSRPVAAAAAAVAGLGLVRGASERRAATTVADGNGGWRRCQAPVARPLSPMRAFSGRGRPGNRHGPPTSAAVAVEEVQATSERREGDGGADTPTFQEAIQRLQDYWARAGCAILQPSSTEVGAGTMNPATYLRVLGPEPWAVAYVEPSIRPDDSRYGDNPNRVQRHTQFQVILKPDPGNPQELYLGSLAALGIDTAAHDVRFVEDNWESPVLGAWGLGWEVWMDGMEISQFTYFQQAFSAVFILSLALCCCIPFHVPRQCGSMALNAVSVEITYGLERIIMSLQASSLPFPCSCIMRPSTGVDHFKKIRYTQGITYGELFLENEREMSTYNLDQADIERVQKRFELYEAEAKSMLKKELAIPAYDHVLKASHAFNVLDARGAIGVTERARFFGRMRALARQCAQLWVDTRERQGFPLGIVEEPKPAPQGPAPRGLSMEAQGPRLFVLELGSEELPPQDVTSAVAQLRAAVPSMLERLRLAHSSVYVSATPRRLTVLVEDLAAKQADKEAEVRGPPTSKAYSAEGQPTKAAEGFCKKNGLSVSDLYVRVDGKTEYVFAVAKEVGKNTVEVLALELPQLLSAITFSKSMRWNSQAVYSRPLRWILALYGASPVPFSFANVSSGVCTRLLRNSERPTLQVETAEQYLSTIQSAGITLSIEDRCRDIQKASSELAADIGGEIPAASQGKLLQEVANLVEAPMPLLGRFDKAFLELPKEVLVTVMEQHQRYFPIEQKETKQLMPAFVAVANGRLNEQIVRNGNEAVLRARYEDASFFYKADLARPLAGFRPLLSGITFQEKLGTMLDKSKRVEQIALSLAELLDISESDICTARQAAPLAMADLSTAMVTEFTSLAGVMGQHYAIKEGQPIEVAKAVFESILPRSAGDALPTTEAGMLLSIAGRLDSLVGLFAVGNPPSATADPFGLRRSAYALVQTLVENNKQLDLRHALPVAAAAQPVAVGDEVIEQVLVFVTRRLEQLLVDSGARVEHVRSVLAERGAVPALAALSVRQMEEVAGRGLEEIAVAYARPTRIVRGKEIDPTWQVDLEVFESDAETALWEAYQQTSSRIHPGVSIGDFVAASQVLVEPLEAFFANVFVMAEDERLQKNRLALLHKLASLSDGVADLSLLPGF
eukprot:SM000002S05723  [mRNA]  locus=s2:1859761:1867448:+ [translate_table: standard]